MKRILLILAIIVSLGGLMAQMQDTIKPVYAWSSFMGCVKACSDNLGCGHSADWLYGVTGYAFILNIHPVVCPSGPTAFDNSFLIGNAGALGLDFDTMNFGKWEQGFEQKQKEAHAKVLKALDAGIPTFGWELALPEYYLIAGTDSMGYLFFDMDRQIKHCPWENLGISEIGMVEIHSLSRLTMENEPLLQVRSALQFLGEYHSDPLKYALEGYTQGTAGYDVWIEAMRSGETDPFGLPFNARVWHEARSHAVGFLKEIKFKLGENLDYSSLDEAIKCYGEVVASLEEICNIYPFPATEGDLTPENATRTIELLREAKNSELKGVSHLLEFAGQL
ncbi:MAG: hypothetical protein ACP5F3_02955 [Candidatus Syntrophosphaera sp.]